MEVDKYTLRVEAAEKAYSDASWNVLLEEERFRVAYLQQKLADVENEKGEQEDQKGNEDELLHEIDELKEQLQSALASKKEYKEKARKLKTMLDEAQTQGESQDVSQPPPPPAAAKSKSKINTKTAKKPRSAPKPSPPSEKSLSEPSELDDEEDESFRPEEESPPKKKKTTKAASKKQVEVAPDSPSPEKNNKRKSIALSDANPESSINESFGNISSIDEKENETSHEVVESKRSKKSQAQAQPDPKPELTADEVLKEAVNTPPRRTKTAKAAKSSLKVESPPQASKVAPKKPKALEMSHMQTIKKQASIMNNSMAINSSTLHKPRATKKLLSKVGAMPNYLANLGGMLKAPALKKK